MSTLFRKLQYFHLIFFVNYLKQYVHKRVYFQKINFFILLTGLLIALFTQTHLPFLTLFTNYPKNEFIHLYTFFLSYCISFKQILIEERQPQLLSDKFLFLLNTIFKHGYLTSFLIIVLSHAIKFHLHVYILLFPLFRIYNILLLNPILTIICLLT